MNQKDACLFALDRAKLFENSGHRTRFKELMDCICGRIILSAIRSVSV